MTSNDVMSQVRCQCSRRVEEGVVDSAPETLYRIRNEIERFTGSGLRAKKEYVVDAAGIAG